MNRARCEPPPVSNECLTLKRKIYKRGRKHEKRNIHSKHRHCHETNNEEDRKYFLEHLNDEACSRQAGRNLSYRRSTQRSNCSCKKFHRRRGTCTGSEVGLGRHFVGGHRGPGSCTEPGTETFQSHSRQYRNANMRIGGHRYKEHRDVEECIPDTPVEPKASKAQSSRSFLELLKLVYKMKPWWEKTVAEEEKKVSRNKYYTRGHRKTWQSENCEYFDESYHSAECEEQVQNISVRNKSKRTNHEDDKYDSSHTDTDNELEQEFVEPEPQQQQQGNLVGSSYDWSDSSETVEQVEEISVKREEADETETTQQYKYKYQTKNLKKQENQDNLRQLSPSRYPYSQKRAIFSPNQRKSPEKEQKPEYERRTKPKELLKENYEWADADVAHTNIIKTTKTHDDKSVTKSQRQRSYPSGLQFSEKVTSKRTDNKLTTKSEGGRRNLERAEQSGPSRFSKTQAELELDFRLLRKYPPSPKKETKSSQTELMLDGQVKIEEVENEDSWDEWISESTKGKTRRKHRVHKMKAEKDTEEQYSEIPAKFETRQRKFGTRSNPAEVPEKVNLKVEPRISRSDTAYFTNTRSPRRYRTEIGQDYHQNIETSNYHEEAHVIHGHLDVGHKADGLKVLRHSKSMSKMFIPTKQEIQGRRPPASAPAHVRKIVEPEGHDEDYDSIDDFVTVIGSASFVEVAMEQGGGIRAGTYTDEILKRLAEPYDSLIMAEPRTQCLDIRESEIIHNDSVHAMECASSLNLTRERNGPIINPKKQRKDGGPFVWRSHSFIPGTQKHKPRIIICSGCQEPIQGGEYYLECKTLSGLCAWHLDCFQCAKCGVPLRDESDCENHQHFFHEGSVYCAQHYSEVTNVPICAACGEFIYEDTYTLARGKPWHKDHFRCGHCQRPIVDTKYVTTHGEVFCMRCHRNLLSVKCNTCGHKITGSQLFIQSGDRYWHAKDYCFHCSTCHKSLVNQNRMFEKNGTIFCNRYCALMNIPPA